MQPLQADSLEQLRHRVSTKWRDFPSDVLPLPVMEMDFEIAQPIRDLLFSLIERSDTGYLGSVPELGKSLATFAKVRWNWSVDPEQVFTATDVGVGVVEMARMVLAPGDGVVVDTPVYHNFFTWIDELKCTAVQVPMKKDGLHYTLNLEGIEEAYQKGAKAHFLCNPQNPVGTVHTREELSAIADLAKKYGVVVFSDEIHAPLTHDHTTFVPFLDVSDTAREVGFTITSASKSWNLAGLKCAQIITAHEKWKATAQAMPPAVHWRSSLFGAFAAAKAYECIDWLDACVATMNSNKAFIAEEIANKVPSIGYRIPDASYVAWLDLTALNLGDEPATVLLEKGKVAFNPGKTFSPTHAQFIRLNFGTSQEIIGEAFNRIQRTAAIA
ncbi:MAG: hypothetical protein RL414_888 [Actinomycetota bacterium]